MTSPRVFLNVASFRIARVAGFGLGLLATLAAAAPDTARAQEQLPWGQSERSRVVQPGDFQGRDVQPSTPSSVRDGYSGGGYEPRTSRGQGGATGGTYAQRDESRGDYPYGRGDEGQTVYPDRRDGGGPRPYQPSTPVYPSSPDRAYGEPRSSDRGGDGYDNRRYGDQGPGRPYEPAPAYPDEPRERRVPYARGDQSESRTYSPGEIRDAGHTFFGKITEGLANVIEHSFKSAGRPTGYILGEEGGGAFIAGLRYGEGVLHMKDGTRQRVYWQGPSIGYDFGAEGSKTMILVYDIDHPGMIYSTYGGVSGSAYLVGGVGLTFLKNDTVVLAPIKSGVGLRFGANLGYLKLTRGPTWNPF